ncbi:MAG TPA: GGDEF domain-containing protein [Arenimonas sp.]|nr:GGDEF domain-containing protein [Arenimonas sp.]
MLDERTILVMSAIMVGLVGFLAAAVRHGHAEFAAGMGSWSAGVILISAGFMMTVLSGGEPSPVRLTLNNAYYVAGMSLLGFGAVRFLGGAPTPGWWFAGTLLVFLGGIALSQSPSQQAAARIGVFMLQQLLVAGAGLLAWWRGRGEGSGHGRLLLLMALLVMAVLALVRGGSAVTGWADIRLLTGARIIWLVVGGISLALVMGTLGMILLAGERTRRRLEQLASHDSLTGLLTRGGFSDLAAHVFAASRRETRRLAFLIVDIDHFKAINDRHGHQAGDAVLAAVAQCLQASAREIDLVSRFGGEEFAVLLPECDGEQARQAAERLRSRVAELRLAHAGHALQVTISIGVASGDATRCSVDALYREADAALYRAKAGGRNRVECADAAAAAATMPA